MQAAEVEREGGPPTAGSDPEQLPPIRQRFLAAIPSGLLAVAVFFSWTLLRFLGVIDAAAASSAGLTIYRCAVLAMSFAFWYSS